jgi:hypothetical protein
VIRREDLFLVQSNMEISRTKLHEFVKKQLKPFPCLSFVPITYITSRTILHGFSLRQLKPFLVPDCQSQGYTRYNQVQCSVDLPDNQAMVLSIIGIGVEVGEKSLKSTANAAEKHFFILWCY